MAGNLAELKAETLDDTPGDLEAEVLVEKMACTVEEVQA